MKIHLGGRGFLLVVVVAAAAVLAVGFFAVLGVRSGVAGPDAAPPAAPPNPGHSWSQIGDLPGTMWHSNNDGPGSGLDADTLDGQSPGPAGGLVAGTLSDLGFMVATVDAIGDVGRYNSVAMGWDGLRVISYLDDTNDDLKVLHCGDAACRFGNTITSVDTGGASDTSITIAADGRPLISLSADGYLKVVHCGNADCSAGNTITTVDPDSGAQYTSVTVGTDGGAVISYHNETLGCLRVAHCLDAACTAGNTIITTVDDFGHTGEHSSVAIGADGLPFISYHNGTDGDLRVAHCNDGSCVTHTTTIVDNAGEVGHYSSATIGTDGLPVISYYDGPPEGYLKVIHCGNYTCTSGNTITTVDGGLGADVGRSTSVTIGADGLPVISYLDVTNGDPKVAHCSNAACTASSQYTLASDTNIWGYTQTSVTVGADGLPVITYFEEANYDLKVAHCSNRFCLPFHRSR